ncbi:hypothetical protein K1T71_003832 [Dendrolimus kikuchii]|uniref:Uncharacterized protein n=1 Tax=Dendrolimus kikuchii TaxID=765133 RepID=A0ACC1D8Z9_9NEOP|nr:hypothetical protein K1T71_003832 [Dendrolimus kikuchii]
MSNYMNVIRVMFSKIGAELSSGSNRNIKENFWRSFYDSICTMMDLSYITHIIYFVFFTSIIWSFTKLIFRNQNLPPGPRGLPFLGCLLELKRTAPHDWYVKMAEKYGDVFSVRLGSRLIVCLGSPTLIQDLFSRNDSTNRPQTPLNKLLGGLGIVHSQGTLWKRQREFLYEKFANLGVVLRPNPNFEKFILMELYELQTELDATEEKAIDPVDILGRHIHNVVCQLMMSFRFEKDDIRFKSLTEKITRGMKLFGSIHIGEYIEYYLKLPGKQTVMKEIKRNLVDVSNFHANFIAERLEARKNRPVFSEPADLLDFYLDTVTKERTSETATKFFPEVNEEKQIVQVMNDLFSAGVETVRTSLLWCLIMVIRNPSVALKLREELRKEVSVGQIITLQHRSKIPFVEAFIYETLRRVTIVPLGTTHVNSAPWNIGEYIIPAGTHIIPLIKKISMDPKLYPEPEKFVPERFLRNGKLYIPQNFIQFGVGQRMCLGSRLARMELFLFFANIMNNYEIFLPEGHKIPELEGVIGSTNEPLHFELHFRKLI